MFIVNLGVLEFDFFLQNVGVLKLLVKVFKSASNLEMCYWLVCKLHKHSSSHLQQYPSHVQGKLIFNLQFSEFTHFGELWSLITFASFPNDFL